MTSPPQARTIATLLGNAIDQDPSQRPATGIFRGMSGVRSRVLAGTGANLVAQGVGAGVQLLSLPMFLYFWDAARYGKWLMLSAVPAYFAMSDGGIVPVAANKISMLRASGDSLQANVVFQSALALVLSAIISMGSIAALILVLLGNGVLDADSRLALWLLILATLVSLFGGLFDAGFRAYGSYAQGVLWTNGFRVFEFVGLATGIALGGTFTAAAMGTLAARCAGSLMLGRICRRRFPTLRWGLAHASRRELRALLRPALAYLVFPLGNGLNIQAVTLIVGALFGAIAVATFNTYRTISRIVVQMTSTFSHAIWVEFSRLYGAGDSAALRLVYRQGLLVGGAISVLLSLAMIPMAPMLLQWWTHGKIAFDALLFSLFALATLVGSLSHVPRVLLLSTNRHGRLSAIYLVVSATGVFATLLAAKILGPSGAVLAIIVVESGMVFLTMTFARGMLDEMRGEPRHDAR